MIHIDEQTILYSLNGRFGDAEASSVLEFLRSDTARQAHGMMVRLNATTPLLSFEEASDFGAQLGRALKRLDCSLAVIYPTAPQLGDPTYLTIDANIFITHRKIGQFSNCAQRYDWLMRARPAL